MDIYKVKGIIWKRGGRNSYDLEEAVNCCEIVSNRYDIAVALELSAAVYQAEDPQRFGLVSILSWRREGTTRTHPSPRI